MWEGKKQRKATGKVDTLVGAQTTLQGDLGFQGGLHLDGNVKGNVTAGGNGSNLLIVSEQGSVEGEIRVPHVIVNGTIIGDVHCTDCVELAPNARVVGNIYYNRIEMALGAEVNGQLVHVTEEEQPSPQALPNHSLNKETAVGT